MARRATFGCGFPIGFRLDHRRFRKSHPRCFQRLHECRFGACDGRSRPHCRRHHEAHRLQVLRYRIGVLPSGLRQYRVHFQPPRLPNERAQSRPGHVAEIMSIHPEHIRHCTLHVVGEKRGHVCLHAGRALRNEGHFQR